MSADDNNIDAQIIVPNNSNSTLFVEEEDVTAELKTLQRKDPLRVVFFGTPGFVVPVLEALHDHFILVGVVTTPDAKVGRKQILTQSSIAQKAEEYGITVIKSPQLNDDTVAELDILNPDLFVVASYGKIIPQSILDIPQYGSINIHPSKLPLFRGATPIQSQILAGVTDSAISFILLDEKMDHGPILHLEPFQISASDTNATLHDSMFQKAAGVLPKLIEDYTRGDITALEQDHKQATFCKPFNRESGYFELDSPPQPEELDRMIRAFYPWPTAWTIWKVKSKNEKVKNQEMSLKFLPDQYVQPEGKKPMKWKEFLNGYKHFPFPNLLCSH